MGLEAQGQSAMICAQRSQIDHRAGLGASRETVLGSQILSSLGKQSRMGTKCCGLGEYVCVQEWWELGGQQAAIVGA